MTRGNAAAARNGDEAEKNERGGGEEFFHEWHHARPAAEVKEFQIFCSVCAEGVEAAVLFVEAEDGALEINESCEFFGFAARMGVDFERHFSHFHAGHVGNEFGIGNAENEAADFEPGFHDFDVFDFAVRDDDLVHFALSADEDVSFEAPREFDIFGKKAEFSNDSLFS